MRQKFIFVTGGVVSSLGKGLASAAIGALLPENRMTTLLNERKSKTIPENGLGYVSLPPVFRTSIRHDNNGTLH